MDNSEAYGVKFVKISWFGFAPSKVSWSYLTAALFYFRSN